MVGISLIFLSWFGFYIFPWFWLVFGLVSVLTTSNFFFVNDTTNTYKSRTFPRLYTAHIVACNNQKAVYLCWRI